MKTDFHCECGKRERERKRLLGRAGWGGGKRQSICVCLRVCPTRSVTRLDNFLIFQQLFNAFGKNYFAQFAHILWQFL